MTAYIVPVYRLRRHQHRLDDLAYIPVLGGVFELAMLYFFWAAALEAQRVARPLRREPLLWIGLALSLIPHVSQFLSIVESGYR
jgi:hypothetical protein